MAHQTFPQEKFLKQTNPWGGKRVSKIQKRRKKKRNKIRFPDRRLGLRGRREKIGETGKGGRASKTEKKIKAGQRSSGKGR